MNDKTYAPKLDDIVKQWYVVDAQDKILGRLASEVAQILRGKNKPYYAPYADVGDHVIIINASKIRVTGHKAVDKIYYRHTGYPGGIRSTSYSQLMQKHPERIVQKAVWGMLPHNKLGRKIYKNLRVYAGAEHRHTAQQPVSLEIRT